MNLAYADPPYLGQAKLYDHPDAGDWDELTTHATLFARLEAEFDGWAVSASSPSLVDLLPLAPRGARVAAWVKPFCAFKANVRVAYSWEPVIFRPARLSSKTGADVTRDFLSSPMTLSRGVVGAKPEVFCHWVLDLLGYLEGDELVDLFPGTGVFGRVLAQGRLAL